jgi:hypothetical protein
MADKEYEWNCAFCGETQHISKHQHDQQCEKRAQAIADKKAELDNASIKMKEVLADMKHIPELRDHAGQVMDSLIEVYM